MMCRFENGRSSYRMGGTRNVSWLTNAIQWQPDKHFRCVRRSRLVSPCAIAEALDARIATRVPSGALELIRQRFV